MPKPRLVEFVESHRKVPTNAKFLHEVKGTEAIEISIYLKPRDEAPDFAMQRPVRVTREELKVHREMKHADDIAIVKKFAAKAGLKVTQVSAAARLVKLAGTAAKMQKTFNTKLAMYEYGQRTFRGREGSLHLPPELLAVVQSVLGLDNQRAAEPQVRFLDPEVAPAGATSFPPNQIGDLYGFPNGTNGTGQCIGIIELGGGYVADDLTRAFKDLNPAPTVKDVSIDGMANRPTRLPGDTDDAEVALDLQVAGGNAPGATLAVYFAPNSQMGIADALAAVLGDTTYKPSVLSLSWVNTEATWATPALGAKDYRTTVDSHLKDLAEKLGVSVFVSSGDYLATFGVAGSANVAYPASSPYAIGCGGTTISVAGNQITGEIVWNDGSDGTGGGVSTLYTVPPFQQGTNLPVNVLNSLPGRGVPDVAGSADRNTGYSIIVNTATIHMGGTSAVAPLWAALTARINEAVGNPIGFFLPQLYQNPQLLRPVTQGNNKPAGSNIGYSAGPGTGWNACTGLGVPDGGKLTAYFKAPGAPQIAPSATMLARAKLKTAIKADIDKRVASHQAMIAEVLAAAPAVTPLTLLAHGDSWFNYPLDGNGISLDGDTDIIAQLPSLVDPKPLICNISHFGDASTVELSLTKQKLLEAALQNPANWLAAGKPDAILISAGGDDIVGDSFCIFLNYATSGVSGLNSARFEDGLGMVEASYLSLFALRDRLAPAVPIIGHCYDFPMPNGVAPLCAGPWLKPSLDFNGWTNIVEATAIVHQALIEFKNILQNLASDPANNFSFIDTQGTLLPPDWANELHPHPPGFNKIALLFANELKARFPDKVTPDVA